MKLVPEIKYLQDALETKVSYERIGKEMDLMFTSKFPFNAMKLLYEFKIVQTVLKFPESCKGNF